MEGGRGSGDENGGDELYSVLIERDELVEFIGALSMLRDSF